MKIDFLKIGDICIVGDGAHASIPRLNNGIMYLTSKNFNKDGIVLNDIAYISNEDYKKYFRDNSQALTKPKENDLIFSIIGSLGGVYLYKKSDIFGLSSSVSILRPNINIINPNFLSYCIKSNYFQKYVEIVKSGSAQGFLSLKMIRNLPVKIPLSLKIQNKIATLLSNYDNLIQNNTKRIKLLEEMAEELYKEWFIRLRFPEYEKSKIVDGVPEGWEKKSLFSTSDVIYGYPLKSSLFNEDKDGEPLVRIRDIKNSTIKTYTTERVIDEKYYLKNGDLIVGMDGDFHFGKWSGGRAILNQRVVCFRPHKDISKYLFYFSLKKDIDYLNYVISGTTVAHLSDKDLKKITLLIPTDKLMNKFQEKVDKFYDLEIMLKVKNQTLKQTRDLLLPRVMSGKLDVRNLPEENNL